MKKLNHIFYLLVIALLLFSCISDKPLSDTRKKQYPNNELHQFRDAARDWFETNIVPRFQGINYFAYLDWDNCYLNHENGKYELIMDKVNADGSMTYARIEDGETYDNYTLIPEKFVIYFNEEKQKFYVFLLRFAPTMQYAATHPNGHLSETNSFLHIDEEFEGVVHQCAITGNCWYGDYVKNGHIIKSEGEIIDDSEFFMELYNKFPNLFPKPYIPPVNKTITCITVRYDYYYYNVAGEYVSDPILNSTEYETYCFYYNNINYNDFFMESSYGRWEKYYLSDAGGGGGGGIYDPTDIDPCLKIKDFLSDENVRDTIELFTMRSLNADVEYGMFYTDEGNIILPDSMYYDHLLWHLEKINDVMTHKPFLGNIHLHPYGGFAIPSKSDWKVTLSRYENRDMSVLGYYSVIAHYTGNLLYYVTDTTKFINNFSNILSVYTTIPNAFYDNNLEEIYQIYYKAFLQADAGIKFFFQPAEEGVILDTWHEVLEDGSLGDPC